MDKYIWEMLRWKRFLTTGVLSSINLLANVHCDCLSRRDDMQGFPNLFEHGTSKSSQELLIGLVFRKAPSGKHMLALKWRGICSTISLSISCKLETMA